MIDVSKVKTNIQNECVELWRKNLGVGAFELFTGFGKSNIMTIIIKKILANNPLSIIHIVVDRQALKDQTEANFKGFANVSVFIVNTYVKSYQKCDLLILDEAHIYLNSENKEFHKVLEFESRYKLILSAKFNDKNKEVLTSKKTPILKTLSLADGSKLKIVPEYFEFAIGVELDQKQRKEYIMLCDQMHKFGSTIKDGNKLGMFMSVLSKDFNISSRVTSRLCFENNLTIQMLKGYASNYMNCVRKRKSLVQNLEQKIDVCKQITDILERKTLVFSETIAISEKIASKLGIEYYHSGVKIKDKKQILNDFLASRDNIKLSSVKGLIAGLDCDNIDLIIQTSYTKDELTEIQKKGRSLRFSDKIKIIINLVALNTVEEDWLKNKGFKGQQFESFEEFNENLEYYI